MRKIYLTEAQLNYLVNAEVLNESKILDTVFNGCKTNEEKKERIKLLAKKGALTLGLLSFLTNFVYQANKTDKIRFEGEVKTIMANAEQNSNVTNNVVNNNVNNDVTTIAYNNNENDTVETSDNTQFASSFDISNEGIEHLISYESVRNDAYYATENERQRGILTVGIGHVIKSDDPDDIKNLKEGDEISNKRIKELFANDVETYNNMYKNAVSKLPKKLQNPSLYPQGFIDVGISLVYNAGGNGMMDTPFFKAWSRCRIDQRTGKIRTDDYNYTISLLKKSAITQKGNVVNGLVNRRNKEYKMASI